MNFKSIITKATLALFISVSIISCKKDDPEEIIVTEYLDSHHYSYTYNTGQIAPTFAYTGAHPDDISVNIELEEQDNGDTKITVTINNSIDGETYNVHVHDMADASSTPNGTPYEEVPNGNIFAKQIVGNGGSASASNTSSMSASQLTANYDGFFVIHDPLQAVSTTDPGTFVVLGVFAR